MFAPYTRPPIPSFEDFVNAPQWADMMHRMAYADSASVAELQQQVQQQIGEQWRILQQLAQWIQDASSQLRLLSMSLNMPMGISAASVSPMSSAASSTTVHSEEPSPNLHLMQQLCQLQLQQQQQQRQPYRFNPETATNTASKLEPYQSCQTIALRARAAAADTHASYDGCKGTSASLFKRRPAAALPIREIMNAPKVEPEAQSVRPKDTHDDKHTHSVALSDTDSSGTSSLQLNITPASPLPSQPYKSVKPCKPAQPSIPPAPPLPSEPDVPPSPPCRTAEPDTPPALLLPSQSYKPVQPCELAQLDALSTSIAESSPLPPRQEPIKPTPCIPPAPPLPQRVSIPPAPPLPPRKPISAGQSTADALAAAEQPKMPSSSEHCAKAADAAGVSQRYKYGVARATCPACSDLNRRAVSADCDMPGAAKSVLQLARMFDKQNGKGVI
ncbi:hypothetical protein LPJ55_000140 [Coemansia sp. RSA 990]|nr:hypothetical protein BX667DRAFT_310598 [Coemansia mojavensis]KAJ1744323.1 hypothetical protein LPJ68_000003 [Coemansia sp. RSA 1086]KAJ1753554.1 hypothetical protein LPJ79_000147 [Coemansia sp. RSA 1821]KAJ1876238.1 hypothetical protein LPJ55_000140 [Coemansia sp. RSA 990]KAJ2675782.1 hypothetical protein IWW42_000827 [Coemansia sp. RSA 1085]